jgi:NADPH2:quinone reductase
MLAIQATRAGGPEVLEAIDAPVRQPQAGQIRVGHRAVGLNFIDTYQRSGLYPMTFPLVLGQEASGVVEAVGEGVTLFVPGDRVAYAGQIGAYAQSHVIAADRAVRLPDGVSFETAAAGLLKGMTAEFLLRRCHKTQPGETILVHAAAGGVGSILVQWAKAIGARVIGTVGSSAKAELARELGCDHVVLYHDEDVPAAVRAITGGAGVSVVYDSVGKDTFDASLASLARRGLFVSFGNASGPVPAFEPLRLSRAGSVFFTRPTLFDYVATTAELDDSAAALFALIADGRVRIEIGQTFPLAEARQAHEALESRRTIGASLLIP